MTWKSFQKENFAASIIGHNVALTILACNAAEYETILVSGVTNLSLFRRGEKGNN